MNTDASTLLRDALLALRYLADLNGSEWIKGDGDGAIDMRQRAKAIQARLFASTSAAASDCNDGRRFFVIGERRHTDEELERTKAQLRAWITPEPTNLANDSNDRRYLPVYTPRDRELLDVIAATKKKPEGWTPPEVADAAATTAVRQACDALVVARIAGETAGYGTDWHDTLAEAIKAAECVRDMS